MNPIATSTASDRTEAMRQFVERMREDLLRASAIIVGHAQMLGDEAHALEGPKPLLDDLDKLLSASKSLYSSVRECLSASDATRSAAELPAAKTSVAKTSVAKTSVAEMPVAKMPVAKMPVAKMPVVEMPVVEMPVVEMDERLHDHWHEVANQLNQILGFCQLLLLQQHDYFHRLSEDLELIQANCRACVATLQQYKSFDLAQLGVRDEVRRFGSATQALHSATFQQALSRESASVLVVDDDETNREQLSSLLHQHHHHVTIAANGHEALTALERDDFDLVLLDLVMPDCNGFETLQRMKADERLRHIPVIVVSGFSDVDHVVTCIAMGADDHLPKPVDHRLLLARMNSCLEKKRLREREFEQFFTPELARYFVRHPERLKEGREAEVTVLFCDIREFSRISERLGPNDTVRWLSDVMSTFSDCIIQHRGVLVDYIGDELMAMWGAPEEQPNHADLACRAAVDILDALPELSRRWQHLVKDGTDVGIGINTGVARVGNTGSNRKFKYGALGNAVNLASRVRGATKYLRTPLLITGSTHQQLHGKFPSRRLCKVRVVNIDRTVELYELSQHHDPARRESVRRYEQALTEFEHKNLLKAASLLGTTLGEDPEDGPSLLLMSRIVDALVLQSDPFDPIWELPGK